MNYYVVYIIFLLVYQFSYISKLFTARILSIHILDKIEDSLLSSTDS